MEKKKPSYPFFLKDNIQIRQDMSKFLLQQISLRHTPGYFTKGKWLPSTDVYETATSFVIKMELAGMSKKKLKDKVEVMIERNKLTISGIRPEDNEDKVAYYQVEINYGPFERVILLPEFINDKNIEAHYDNGFLTIIVKKQPRPIVAKNILIKIN